MDTKSIKQSKVINPEYYSFTSNIDFRNLTDIQKQKILKSRVMVSKVSDDKNITNDES